MTVTLTVAEHCWSCGCKGERTYKSPAASTEHAKPVLNKNKLLGVKRAQDTQFRVDKLLKITGRIRALASS